MGKFTFDSSICANSTVDIVATELVEPPVIEETVVDAVIDESKQIEIAPVLKEDLAAEAPLPPPPPELVFGNDPAEDDLNNFTCDDVEMMSVVMENMPEEEDHYTNVPLPDEEGEEAFPDPPPSTSEMDVDRREEEDIQEEIPESPVKAAEEEKEKVLVEESPLNVTGPMVDEEVTSPDSPPEQLHAEEQPSITRAKSMDASQGADDFGDFPKDFKIPTVLRRSLNSQPQSFGANPFDGATSGTADHKQEGKNAYF